MPSGLVMIESRAGMQVTFCFFDACITIGGSNYSSAVRRCINSEFYQQGSGLGDDAPQKDVLVGVLGLLEQDLERAMG